MKTAKIIEFRKDKWLTKHAEPLFRQLIRVDFKTKEIKSRKSHKLDWK